MTIEKHRAAVEAAKSEENEANEASKRTAEALATAEREYDAAPSGKTSAAVWTARQAHDLAGIRQKLARERREGAEDACEAFEAATSAAAALQEAEALRAAQQARFSALAPEIGREAYLRQIGPHVGRILDLRDALVGELAACAALADAQQGAAVEAAALASALGEASPAPVEADERAASALLGAPAMVRYAVHGAALARPLAPDVRDELLLVLAAPESAGAILSNIFARYRTTDSYPHVPPAEKLSLLLAEGIRSPGLLGAERRALALEGYEQAKACTDVAWRGVLAAKIHGNRALVPALGAEERADVERWAGEGAAEHARRVASFREACSVGYGPSRGPREPRARIEGSRAEDAAKAWWSLYHSEHEIPDPGIRAFDSFYHSEGVRILAQVEAERRSVARGAVLGMEG